MGIKKDQEEIIAFATLFLLFILTFRHFDLSLLSKTEIMKRIALICIAISLVSSAVAQKSNTAGKWPTFLTQEQLPDGTKYLPAPPDTSSIAYLNDFHQYQWGKSMRHTERGCKAVFDADVSTDSIMKGFAESFGISVTKKSAPEIYALIERVINDAGNAVRTAKNMYHRKRPYVQYNEPTAVPAEEKDMNGNCRWSVACRTRAWITSPRDVSMP